MYNEKEHPLKICTCNVNCLKDIYKCLIDAYFQFIYIYI